MKRFISLILCLTLGFSLCLAASVSAEEESLPETAADGVESAEPPAPVGEQSMDAALTELTLKVKEALGVDDGYTDFSSDYYDGPDPTWSLNWSDEERSLSVEARPDGTVLNMYRWDSAGRSERFYGFDPAFPPLTPDEAAAQAEAWCAKLFTGEESGRIDDTYIGLGSDGYYRISGTVLKNALESPISFTMVLDGTGMTSFYRSDSSGYVGDTPAAEAAADADAAADSLAGAVELELRWVSDGAGGAKLMYVPVGDRTVVDAQTGETVDMDALYENMKEKGLGSAYDAAAPAAEASMNAADGGAYLTEIEQSSIDNYGDVLSQTAIDEALRGVEQLGLEGFELTRCSYGMDSESGGVTASVRYSGVMTADRLYGFSADAFDRAVQDGQDMVIGKYISLDAKTGDIKSVSTSYPLWERDEEPGLDAQAELAESFAEQVVPALAEQAAGCTLKGYDKKSDVVLAQVKDGYFYPDNRIEIHADPDSGVVDEFWYTWDEDVLFASGTDIIDGDEALAAYTGALDVTLGYVAWPVDIAREDSVIYADWLRWGYSYVEELRLAYYYGGTERVRGVDALTGEAALAEEAGGAYTYGDLDGEALADEIETLGLAGVGFSGGSFLPAQELTVRDAALLLLRAAGAYAPEDDDDRLMEQAVYEGFLTRKGWEPDQSVSRMEFLRMVLTPSRYGYAAALTGIWDAGFSDVDEADAAYGALARALGLAGGDTLSPDETLTRAAAADILYRFMKR